MITNGVYFHTLSITVDTMAIVGVDSQYMFSSINPNDIKEWLTMPISGLNIQRQIRAMTTVGTM